MRSYWPSLIYSADVSSSTIITPTDNDLAINSPLTVSSRPSRARPLLLKSSLLILLIMSSPKSRTRRAYHRINNVWFSLASNLRMDELFQTTTFKRYDLRGNDSRIRTNISTVGKAGCWDRTIHEYLFWSSKADIPIFLGIHSTPCSPSPRWYHRAISQGIGLQIQLRQDDLPKVLRTSLNVALQQLEIVINIFNRPVSHPVLRTAERRSAGTPINYDQRRSSSKRMALSAIGWFHMESGWSEAMVLCMHCSI